jgi:outer membrane lipoprotein SlyB
MTFKQAATNIVLSSLLLAPAVLAQDRSEVRHDRAEAAQTRHDHRHHTGAKIVGGSAAGGAVVGALAGGGKGALIGGAIGAGGGAVANKVRKDKAVNKRERRDR